MMTRLNIFKTSNGRIIGIWGTTVHINIDTILQPHTELICGPPETTRIIRRLIIANNVGIKLPVKAPITSDAAIINIVFKIIDNEYAITSTECVCSGLASFIAAAIDCDKVFILTYPFCN